MRAIHWIGKAGTGMSSGWKVFLTVVAILLVIGLLVGAGVALYRLGYAHGLAAAGTLPWGDRLPDELSRGMPWFDGARRPVRWFPGHMTPYGGYMMPFGMFPFGGGLFGLLLLAGIITLIVLGIRALSGNRPSKEVEATPVEPVPAAPARTARRTK